MDVNPFTDPIVGDDGGDFLSGRLLMLESLEFPLVCRPPTPKRHLVIGVVDPEDALLCSRHRRASDAARKRRLVVPNALVEPERAEQTMTTLFSSM
jgi:hypothetical protein